MSQPQNRVIWSSIIKTNSVEGLHPAPDPKAVSVSHRRPTTDAVEHTEFINLLTERVSSVLQKSSSTQDLVTAHNGFDKADILKIHINTGCKNENTEFTDEKSIPKDQNISAQTEHAQALNVSTIFNIADAETEIEIEEFLDNDEEITIPKYNDRSELEQRKTSKNSNVFFFQQESMSGQPEKLLEADIKLHISNLPKREIKKSQNSNDTDSEMEINEFLDNDEKVTIPEYNKIDSAELDPSTSVCHKKASRNIGENGKDTTTEIYNLSMDKCSKDESGSEGTDFDEDNSDIAIQKTDEKFINFICPQCGKSCKDRAHWTKHTNIKHKFLSIETLNMEISTDDGTNWTHKCRDCNFQLINPTYSKTFLHRLSHLPFGRYCICKICSRGFYSRKRLLEHVRSHTGMVRNIQTPPDYEKLDYQKHIRLRCPICLENQTDERESFLHLETQHDYFNQMKSNITFNMESRTCNVCNHKLQSRKKSYIIDHMISHEPHKAYVCELCDDYEGSSRKNVVSHIHKMHFRKGRKLKCNFCSRTFNYNRARLRHYKSEHNVKDHECKACHKYFSNVPKLLSHMKRSKHY